MGKTGFILMAGIALFSIASASASVEDFTGEFRGSCSFNWNTGEVEKFETEAYSTFDVQSNYLLIELSNSRQLIVFDRINEPKKEFRGSTDTRRCVRRSHETSLTNNVLTITRSTRGCFIPVVSEFTKATAVINSEKRLTIAIKNELGKVNCNFVPN